MTTVNDFIDILRIIREQPEWADALRSALLSKDVLELPQRLAEFAEATNKRLAAQEGEVAEIKIDVSDLKAGQARLEAGQARLEAVQTQLEGEVAEIKVDVSELKVGQARLEEDVARLRGNSYEQKAANNIVTIVRHPLDIGRVRVLKGYAAINPMIFHEFMGAAEEQGTIDSQERTEAGSTDIVLQGQRVSDLSNVYVAVEVSVTAANSDINQAADRSDLLRRATGEESLPAVVSAHIDADRQMLAQVRNVTLIAVGE